MSGLELPDFCGCGQASTASPLTSLTTADSNTQITQTLAQQSADPFEDPNSDPNSSSNSSSDCSLEELRRKFDALGPQYKVAIISGAMFLVYRIFR